MDPVPAYTDKSFEERVNEVNELALHLKDSFSSAKFHLAKLDEALADPTVATVPKFTEIQEKFMSLILDSRISAQKAAFNIKSFIGVVFALINDQDSTDAERAEGLVECTGTLKDDSVKDLAECKARSEEVGKQVAALKVLLAKAEAALKGRQHELQEFNARVKNVPEETSSVDIITKITRDLLPMAMKLLGRFLPGNALPIEPNSSKDKAKGDAITDIGAIIRDVRDAFDDTDAKEKEKSRQAVLKEFNEAKATLGGLETTYAEAEKATAHLASEFAGLLGSLGDFSAVWKILISHSEELKRYVTSSQNSMDEVLFTKMRSEAEIYRKTCLDTYSMVV